LDWRRSRSGFRVPLRGPEMTICVGMPSICNNPHGQKRASEKVLRKFAADLNDLTDG
jgi:hypothetical protein